MKPTGGMRKTKLRGLAVSNDGRGIQSVASAEGPKRQRCKFERRKTAFFDTTQPMGRPSSTYSGVFGGVQTLETSVAPLFNSYFNKFLEGSVDVESAGKLGSSSLFSNFCTNTPRDMPRAWQTSRSSNRSNRLAPLS